MTKRTAALAAAAVLMAGLFSGSSSGTFFTEPSMGVIYFEHYLSTLWPPSRAQMIREDLALVYTMTQDSYWDLE